MSAPAWHVLFYTDDRGREPVRAFLADLDQRIQARMAWALDQLRIRNVLAREPLVRHLDGPLWELRRDSNGNTYRLLYTLLPERRILVLHGFQKRSQTTPRREIETAQARLADFQRRLEGV